MSKHKMLALLMVVILLVPVVAGCAPKVEPTATPEPPKPKPTKAPPALGTAENPIILSMVPSGDTPEILASADQITNLLMEKTGYVIEGSVATSYAAVIEAMGTAKAHMGTLATFAYLLAHEKYGVECALVSVRYGSPYYKGQIIANADSGITQISDIAGKTMCWVDAASTSGYIVPSVMLKAAGVDPDTDLAQQLEAGSHDNVVLSVYQGDCDAGATYVDARGKIADDYPDVNDKVIVIEESAEIPNDGLQFIKEFPADMKAKIVQAFKDIMATEEGKAAMKLSYQWSEVIEKDDTFYDGFRATLNASGIDIAALSGPMAIPTPVPPKPGGTFVVAMGAQPDTLFPDFASTASSVLVQSVIYNGLTKLDRHGNAVGDLAESWTVSDDELTWTFKIREGVKWHDGQPLTADDVKFSFEFPADPEYVGNGFSGVAPLVGAQAKADGEAKEIAGVKVIDEQTISFTTNVPYALFLETVAIRYIMPAHVLKDIPVAEYAESAQARSPVGSGPYQLTDWKPDESLTFQAFEDYAGQRAYIDTYIWKILPETATQITELVAGGVDAVTGVSADDFPALEENPNLQTMHAPGTRYTFVEFNHSKPMFSDAQVRQALCYAVDKQAMLDALDGGFGTIALGPVHPSLPEYSLTLKGYPYNPDEAKTLLADAGWTDDDGDGVLESHGVEGLDDGTPFSVKLGAVTFGNYVPQALIVQQYLKDVGVETEIEEVGFNIYFSEYLTPFSDFDMAGSSWANLFYHPQLDLEYSYQSESWNAQVDRYANTEVDELIAKAPTILDATERRQAYWRIQEILEEDAARMFLTRGDYLAAFDKGLSVPKFASVFDLYASIPLLHWK